MNKQPWPVRLLLASGLCMVTMPLLFNEYVHMPDFLRGTIEGFGIGMEISAFVLMRRNNKNSCKNFVSQPEIGDF